MQAREGSGEALAQLLKVCRRYLLLMAEHELTTIVHSKIAPSDIVQDTLIEAWRDFVDFRGATEEELLGWLRRILRNNVSNVHRHFEAEKRQVDREISLEGGEADALMHHSVQKIETPSMHAQARERDEQLEKAMQQLPEHYRQVLFFHTTEGLTFAQIADKLGSTADAVRKLWGRAVDELAKLLDSPHESG
jgi:RNA polymerase sigma-70 factor (ECF subfamily)